jgi:FkbM family methyltransferase
VAKANSPLRRKSDYSAYRAVDTVLRYGLRFLPSWSWTERLALWWGYRFRPNPCVAKLRSGALIQVVPTDYLPLMIYYFGTFEPKCLKYLKQCTSKGGTIVDVGANIGVYTLEGSFAVGPTGRVISIEAAPSLVDALRENIQLNGMNNVSLIEAAVGDSVGEAILTLPNETNLGGFTLGPVSGDKAYSVAVRLIDDLLDERGINSVDLIKMDIEGSEYRALRGAARTLARCRPVLMIELNEFALSRCGSSAREVKELLHASGYRGWVIGRKAVRMLPESRSTHECDECLFIHRDNQLLISRLRLP